MRRGQAMLETILAVFFVTILFLGLFELSLKLNKRIIFDFAAQRVARAKAVGLNDYMCLKAARVATLSVAGNRLWPEKSGSTTYDTSVDLGRIPIYLESEHEARARAILDYDLWHKLKLTAKTDGGLAPEVNARVASDDNEIVGESRIESHYSHYLNSFE